MTHKSQAKVGSGGLSNGPQTPATAIGPPQLAARSIVAPFDPVAYVYAGLGIPVEADERDLRSRGTVQDLLRQGAPEQAAAAIAARIAAAPSTPGILAAFVATDGTVLYEQVLAGAELPHEAGWQSPPTVTGLLAWEQDHPPYVLVVTDRTGADITAAAGAGQPEQTWTVVGPDDEIERKHGPGGWSQPSYQHRIEDSWRHNAARVAEEVAARVADVGAQVLVLSGDVRAVQLLSERLPNDPALLVHHITGSRAADGSQATRGRQVAQALREAGEAQNAELLRALNRQLTRGGLAVQGVEDTLDALASGRVATLLVQPVSADSRVAWFGAGPTDVYRDHDAAALSGAPVRSGRLIDVAVRSALLSGAHVRVITPGIPDEPVGGIGAFCRFARQSGPSITQPPEGVG
ncbi:MAG TPA: Vms1/Ankzf1 family peptidyl-tRNA hydrolase [Dermatophilaceae bacterium]|nr:Vms1/Ankzf1 family peptidyl-tRNA hydrolase [Dermatophilaceae bacterium]